MLAGDVERFETSAGALLNELGYARAFPHAALESVKDSGRRRDLFLRQSSRCARVFKGAVSRT